MKGALALRNPCGTPAALDTSSTNVTTAAYVELKASTEYACSAVIVSNGGDSALLLAKGAAASEVDTGAIIPPNSYGVIIPIEIGKAKRLSLKALGANQTSGIVTIGFLQ